MTTLPGDSYAASGVSIDEGNRAVELIKAAVRSTYTPEVLAGIGAFGGVLDVTALKRMDAPALVASTDGVGTKTKVASKLNRWDTVGQDLVNHCVNDILVQGATPLFFMDYVASSKLNAEQVAAIVSGMAVACREAGMPLLGGETAEMPDVYQDDEVDVAGTIVGVADRARLIDGSRIHPGDALIGLPSSGLHTNGYSLARRVLGGLSWSARRADLGGSVGDALLAVHRSYLPAVRRLWGDGVDVRGLAHITGGGIVENLPRALPDGVSAIVRRASWPAPPIFELIRREGNVSEPEMFRVFNMGVGMIAIVPDLEAARAIDALGGQAHRIGDVVAGERGVRFD